MALTIQDLNVDGSGVGISMGSDDQVSINTMSAQRTGTAVLIREPSLTKAAFMRQLGLPEDTDPKLVVDLAIELHRARLASEEEKTQIIRESKLMAAVSSAANLATVAQFVLPASASGFLANAMTFMMGG